MSAKNYVGQGNGEGEGEGKVEGEGKGKGEVEDNERDISSSQLFFSHPIPLLWPPAFPFLNSVLQVGELYRNVNVMFNASSLSDE